MRLLLVLAVAVVVVAVESSWWPNKKVLRLRLKRKEPTPDMQVVRALLAQMNHTDCGPHCHSEVHMRQVSAPTQGLFARGISFVDLALGTPPQKMRVVFDTGSSELWVARAKGCQDDGSPGAICSCTTFKEPSPSTKLLSDKLDLQYGSGRVDGVYATDSDLGDPKCKNHQKMNSDFKFGLGEVHQGMRDMSGILGMSYKLPPGYGRESGDSLMQKMVDGGMEPKYSTYAKQCDPPQMGNKCANAGVVTFGAFDTKNCGKELVTFKVKNFHNEGDPTELPFALHFRFDVDGIWMETKEGKKEVTWKSQKLETITDTGCSGMLMPANMVQAFQSILPAGCQSRGSNAVCPCNAEFTLWVQINGVPIGIPAKNMLISVTSDHSMCQVLFMSANKAGKFNFGDPFVRTVCHHYHWKDHQITLAQPK